jgi:hypothetical protein
MNLFFSFSFHSNRTIFKFKRRVHQAAAAVNAEAQPAWKENVKTQREEEWQERKDRKKRKK